MHRILKGWSVKDIAEDMGYHPQSVSIIIKTDSFQRELGILQNQLMEHLQDEMSKLHKLIPGAIGFYKEVLKVNDGSGSGNGNGSGNNPVVNYSPNIKFKVSKDLLDRVGLKHNPQIDVNHHHDLSDTAGLVVSAFQTATGKDVSAAVKLQDSQVIDAEVVNDITQEQLLSEVRELMEEVKPKLDALAAREAAPNIVEPTEGDDNNGSKAIGDKEETS
jgi:hypothetical protein